MRVPRRSMALLLVATLSLAGCFGLGGGKDVPVAPAETNDTNETIPTVLPDGREFKAVEETNKTEVGVGGELHPHDYWKGKEQVTIFDGAVPVSGIFERGDNSKVGIAFLNLGVVPGTEDETALVYEGTGLVSITLTKGTAWAESYQITFRTGAKDWSPWSPITIGTPFVYEPDKMETDMPHAARSLWNWKVQAVGPVPLTGDVVFGDGAPATAPESTITATVVVTKARDPEHWPGHPAFYDGLVERVVAKEKPGKTTVQQAADVVLYGVEPDQVVPDLLISSGSRTLDVHLNITKLELPPGVPNGGFTLYWRTANTTPDSLGIFSLANETDDKTYAYWHLDLKPEWLDSPYQPHSRFGFKVLANVANDEVIACYRCVPYNIEYTMTIIARPDPNATGPVAMPE